MQVSQALLAATEDAESVPPKFLARLQTCQAELEQGHGKLRVFMDKKTSVRNEVKVVMAEIQTATKEANTACALLSH